MKEIIEGEFQKTTKKSSLKVVTLKTVMISVPFTKIRLIALKENSASYGIYWINSIYLARKALDYTLNYSLGLPKLLDFSLL